MKNYIIPDTKVLMLQTSLMQARNVSGGGMRGTKTGDGPAAIN